LSADSEHKAENTEKLLSICTAGGTLGNPHRGTSRSV